MASFLKLKILTPHMLAKNLFFKKMDICDLEILSKKMKVLNVEEGDLIISEGEKSETMYFIIEGEVLVFRESSRGGIEYVYEMSAPSYFGEMAIMDGGPRSASVKAQTNTVLAELNWNDVRVLFEDRPEIMCYFFQNIANVISMRLRRTNAFNSCMTRS